MHRTDKYITEDLNFSNQTIKEIEIIQKIFIIQSKKEEVLENLIKILLI